MSERLLSDLKSHPLNLKIYGDEHDDILLESIKTKGILNPIVITHDNRIISGHRRRSAALVLGIETVPVFVSPLTDELDIEEAIILSNKDQRTRTKEQMAREFTRLKEIEGERALVRKSLGGQGGIQDVENLPHVDPGKARDIAAQKLGMSGKSAENAAKVVQVVDNLEMSGDIEKAAVLRDALNGQSVNAAYQQAKEIIKQNPEVEKPSAKSTFNSTNDNIEWAKWSWNPVTGCLHDCVYCYARDIGIRFSGHFKPEFHPERLNAPSNTRVPEGRKTEPGIKNVFVCSMADLFGDWVDQSWIDQIIEQVRNNQQWNFLFLTKNPKRYIGIDWPKNAWVGTTVDNQDRAESVIDAFEELNATDTPPAVTFLSCEPLLSKVSFGGRLDLFDWVIIGGQSRSSKCEAYQPEWEWVESLLTQARESECKVYFKPNLSVRPKEYPEA